MCVGILDSAKLKFKNMGLLSMKHLLTITNELPLLQARIKVYVEYGIVYNRPISSQTDWLKRTTNHCLSKSQKSYFLRKAADMSLENIRCESFPRLSIPLAQYIERIINVPDD